ncbi:hypothetical protein A5791_12980 [Mycobacterium sp. 852002-51163_SCH5372311]|uniref:hypothetical protein n=1 Tax=Mycobacterium sp. 852002-51163_SCH5372311 TaxID=1834097 RepID=UPI0007FBE64F|nr:hypothetical protein [Mycobacterium sp. 852002-51163_SCH5372311]OBF92983.1 hypothetical protein A5791_12980 [Mycobacterium sp. 852002-51163_SCH5372311]
MGAPDSDPPQHGEGDADPPLTVDLLADLQAGLLDDEAAARVRSRVRADPEAEDILRALNRVRTDLGDLGVAGADSNSAPPPAGVTAAPRSSAAAHSARPPIRPGRLIAGIAGLGALVVAIGLGTSALLNAPPPTSSTPATADHITVPGPATGPAAAIPLSQPQILELLNQSPDYGTHGALEDPPRRASCLRGLGYPPSTSVLGARPVEVDARPGVLLVLPGDTPQDLAVFAVGLNCSAVDTGLLASTQIPRS